MNLGWPLQAKSLVSSSEGQLRFSAPPPLPPPSLSLSSLFLGLAVKLYQYIYQIWVCGRERRIRKLSSLWPPTHTTPSWAIRPCNLKAGPLEVCGNVFQCVWERRCRGMKTMMWLPRSGWVWQRCEKLYKLMKVNPDPQQESLRLLESWKQWWKNQLYAAGGNFAENMSNALLNLNSNVCLKYRCYWKKICGEGWRHRHTAVNGGCISWNTY